MLTNRRILVFISDLLLISAALGLSFLIRFDFSIPIDQVELFKDCLIVLLVVKPLVFIATGFYQNIWRYASLQDAIEIFKGVLFSSILAVSSVLFISQFTLIPRSIFLIDAIILFSFLAASRLIWRLYRECYHPVGSSSGPRALIVGAGEAGSMLLKEICRHPVNAFNVIGFVDDDAEKKGLKLHGIPVLGSTKNLKLLIRTNEIEEVIIAMPSADGRIIRAVMDSCKNENVIFRTLPSIANLVNGRITVSQIRKVELEDLLGREQVVLDRELIGGYLNGKRVLVTGAGGSIGSEICRQVAAFAPESLIVLDQAETPLYEVEKELVAAYPNIRVIPLIADIRDREIMFSLFDDFLPEVVFHAAAYKHVPMMEYNPVQAVLNNIFGSKNVVDAACHCKVEKFVMLSTDKAVNPTNVMGATKRVAEIYVQSVALTSKTRFTTVRFGNVLASNGSVIPLFRDQIAAGGPVTVTDRRVIRYFMTITEATQLVLQAGCIGGGNEILVLDMGEPVRIVDLAEELIRMSGFIPYQDIDITFTGLRPGEKLFEELLIEGEGVLPTAHDKIRVLAPVQVCGDTLVAEMESLFSAARADNIVELVASLKRLVPEFRPSSQLTGKAPLSFKRGKPNLSSGSGETRKVLQLPRRV